MPVKIDGDMVTWTNERGDLLFFGSKDAWERLHVSADKVAREITERIDAEVMAHFKASQCRI